VAPLSVHAARSRPTATRAQITRAGTALAVGFALVGFLALSVSSGPEGRIRAPGIAARPGKVLGITSWAVPIQVVCFTGWALFLAYVIWANRRSERLHPAFVVFVGLSVCALQDPIQNWAVYAAYDPRLLHFPLSWPYFNLAPTVEPLLPLLLYPIAFGLPGLVSLDIHRRLVRRSGHTGWMIRHPLLSVFVVGEVIGIVTTFISEFVATRLHTFTFTQLTPAVTLFEGRQGQMHFLYEGPFLGMLIAICAMLMSRDDSGLTVLDRVTERSRRLRARPRLAVLALGAGVLSVYYVAYMMPYMTMRLAGSSSSIVRSWPYPNTKIYDPQGRYREAGIPGPYYKGTWP
jgi:Spirocyclase AveC-like